MLYPRHPFRSLRGLPPIPPRNFASRSAAEIEEIIPRKNKNATVIRFTMTAFLHENDHTTKLVSPKLVCGSPENRSSKIVPFVKFLPLSAA